MFIMANKFWFYILKGFQRYDVAQAGEFSYPTTVGNPSIKRYGIKKEKKRWGCLHPTCTLQVSYWTPNVSPRVWQRPCSGDATIKPVMLGVREVKRKQHVMTCTFQDWKAFQLSSYQLPALTCNTKNPNKTPERRLPERVPKHTENKCLDSAASFVSLRAAEAKTNQVKPGGRIKYGLTH